jgi:hypothetical protein
MTTGYIAEEIKPTPDMTAIGQSLKPTKTTSKGIGKPIKTEAIGCQVGGNKKLFKNNKIKKHATIYWSI